MLAAAYDVHIVQPKGYELSNAFTKGATIHYNQEEAFAGADFIYAKNWSSFSTYGKNLQLPNAEKWIIDEQKMRLTNNGKFMHCLPIRRNVIASDKVIDDSLVYQQANNRTFSAQVVLKKIVEAI
jgi:N-succinyl-L-ornithine transcarbamylase